MQDICDHGTVLHILMELGCAPAGFSAAVADADYFNGFERYPGLDFRNRFDYSWWASPPSCKHAADLEPKTHTAFTRTTAVQTCFDHL